MLLNIVYIVQLVICGVLIWLVMSRSGKDQGLGALGGGSQPTSRFKPGFEQRLDDFTRNIAIAFMVVCLLSAYLNR